MVFIDVNLFGGSELVGVQAPGMPAVAPVEAGPLLLKPGCFMSMGDGGPSRDVMPLSGALLLHPGAGSADCGVGTGGAGGS
jgi:hypothetical protein